MRVFIIGMPGSGKSTIAKEIAKLMNLELIDSDVFIELKYKLKIDEIFKNFGEDKFREYENLALKKIIKKDNFIFATGGGMPCFNNNMGLMNEVGKTIYLKYSPKILLKRIENDISVRPLIEKKNKSEILEYLETTLIIREKYYKTAQLTIDADKNEEEVLSMLINNL